MATQSDIKRWLKRKKPHHTHMLVVCDTFSWDDYPVFSTNPTKDRVYYSQNMQRVMEIYDLNKDLGIQFQEERAIHCAPARDYAPSLITGDA